MYYKTSLRDFDYHASAALKKHVLSIFTETFATTQMLRWIVLFATCLAALGNLSQVFVLRAKSVATLKQIGVSELEILYGTMRICINVLWRSLCVGILGGLSLAAILIIFINPRFFGWSFDWHLDYRQQVYELSIASLLFLSACLIPHIIFNHKTARKKLYDE